MSADQLCEPSDLEGGIAKFRVGAALFPAPLWHPPYCSPLPGFGLQPDEAGPGLTVLDEKALKGLLCGRGDGPVGRPETA